MEKVLLEHLPIDKKNKWPKKHREIYGKIKLICNFEEKWTKKLGSRKR